MRHHNSLTPKARQLVEYLAPCIQLSDRIDAIDRELDAYEGLELTQTEADLREERRQTFSLLCRYRNEVYDRIRDTPSLSASERSVVRLRYLRGVKWENICITLHRSKSDVLYHHRNAMNKLVSDKQKGAGQR